MDDEKHEVVDEPHFDNHAMLQVKIEHGLNARGQIFAQQGIPARPCLALRYFAAWLHILLLFAPLAPIAHPALADDVRNPHAVEEQSLSSVAVRFKNLAAPRTFGIFATLLPAPAFGSPRKDYRQIVRPGVDLEGPQARIGGIDPGLARRLNFP